MPPRILCQMDEGHPIHYSALERGTPVHSIDGVEVGKVDAVLDNYREHILDGIVIETATRELRFVDAPEVQRTSENLVTLNISGRAGSAAGDAGARAEDVQAAARRGAAQPLSGRRLEARVSRGS